MDEIIGFKRIRETSRLPAKAYRGDAGADVFYDGEDKILDPGESALFRTGLKTTFPQGFMLEVKNKSGIASKRSLVVGACVIDSGYEGEIFVNLHNIGRDAQIIKRDSKLAQLVLIPIYAFDVEEIPDLYENGKDVNFTGRGEGSLGSTGD